MDRVSIKRMCAGREFQVEGADTGKARDCSVDSLHVAVPSRTIFVEFM